jgi:hypothetical protein
MRSARRAGRHPLLSRIRLTTVLVCVPLLGGLLASGDTGAASADRVPVELFAKAAHTGSVWIIAQLRTSESSGQIPAPAAIRAAQDAVLAELTGTGHRVVSRYSAIPFLALEVSIEALRILAASSRVVDVREDVVLGPLVTAAPRPGAP